MSASSIVEGSIEELAALLASGSLTAVDLVSKYLLRISTYDTRNTFLNSIPLLNEDVFREAQAADDRRANGKSLGILDGIPFTVKDSYKVKGMTVASGSEAFQDLVANEDAFVTRALRDAGAVLLGKTNMCPMAYGGMLRGVYGRAESPYNKDYLAAAFGSGSSNGSGASTAASFAAFGMGEETVSSGRSPASNNALVAYTPSRGVISIRGNWPLYPTCDVIVPNTRTMGDLLALLDVITSEDRITSGDFWRDQPFIQIPTFKRPESFVAVMDVETLKSKRMAVPNMYLTQTDHGPFISKSIDPLWQQVRAELEALGATVSIIDDFPVIEAYENPRSLDKTEPRLPDNWNACERGSMIAHAWEDFLQENKCTEISSLKGVRSESIFPHLPPSDPQVKFTEPANAVHWSELATYIRERPAAGTHGKSPIYDLPNLETAVHALEAMRKHYFEDWMDRNEYDFVVFPAVGDVARADADISDESAEHAWTNGVKYSHGNRMLRHLGIPSVTVPMGVLQPSGMPIGLTILGRAYEDVEILKAAYLFEQRRPQRSVPPLVPSLPSDSIPTTRLPFDTMRPDLKVTECSASGLSKEKIKVFLKGTLHWSTNNGPDAEQTQPRLYIYVDGELVNEDSIKIEEAAAGGDPQPTIGFSCEWVTPRVPDQDDRNAVVGKIARDSTMVMAIARIGEHGRPSGFLKLIHASSTSSAK